MFDCTKVSCFEKSANLLYQITRSKKQLSHLPAQRSDNRRQSVRWCNLRSLTSPVALYLSRVKSKQSQVRQACFGILCFRFVHFCTYLSFYATFMRRYASRDQVQQHNWIVVVVATMRRSSEGERERERPRRCHKLKTTREFPAKLSRIWPDLESVPTSCPSGSYARKCPFRVHRAFRMILGSPNSRTVLIVKLICGRGV